MEKTRTLYRIRKYKNSVLLTLITLFSGVLLFSAISIFEFAIKDSIKAKVSLSVAQHDGENVNASEVIGNICERSYGFFVKSCLVAILFSIEGFVFIFFFVRLSMRTKRVSSWAPFLLSLGAFMLSLYYFILGV